MRAMGRTLLVWLLLLGSLGLPGRAQRPSGPTLAVRVTERIRAVPGAEVAVSYRDLATGDSVDIGADVDFHAASTMKIPVMLEVVRASEQERLGLSQEILLVNRFHSIVDGSPYSLNVADDGDSSMYARVGHRVPVRELLERMIVRSSNLPPGRAPYVLVVLTRRIPSEAVARALIVDVSRLVWQHSTESAGTAR